MLEIERAKVLLGNLSFSVLSGILFMRWFELNIFVVICMIFLIGYIGIKMKDNGYDWTAYRAEERDPFEIQLLCSGLIMLLISVHFFVVFVRLAPIVTIFDYCFDWIFC
ncbi:hypothetical protein CEXT_568401 [Caerostris extrusa]|uniref:Uncharacterized protein n=1 Tax=Caerostris extrusa TaxID=172846 RepID=A0AAV4Q0E3_CAEEX|nr:hypothetical protein CEXT_568401 [Caerostris extrusa]